MSRFTPKAGDAVLLRYARETRRWTGRHGQIGVVVFTSSGPGPINHLVRIDGSLVCVPRGQVYPRTLAKGGQLALPGMDT